MLDVALGELGLTPKTFWGLTLVEFDAMRRGRLRRDVRAWQHTRYLAWMLVGVNSSGESALPSLSEFMPLPGDEDYERLSAPAPVKPASEKADQEARIRERLAKNNPDLQTA